VNSCVQEHLFLQRVTRSALVFLRPERRNFENVTLLARLRKHFRGVLVVCLVAALRAVLIHRWKNWSITELTRGQRFWEVIFFTDSRVLKNLFLEGIKQPKRSPHNPENAFSDTLMSLFQNFAAGAAKNKKPPTKNNYGSERVCKKPEVRIFAHTPRRCGHARALRSLQLMPTSKRATQPSPSLCTGYCANWCKWFGNLLKRSTKKHVMSICPRTHPADWAQPYTPSDVGKLPRRLRGSKQGPLLGGCREARPTDRLFDKRPLRNTLAQHTVARTRQVRRVPADQPVDLPARAGQLESIWLAVCAQWYAVQACFWAFCQKVCLLVWPRGSHRAAGLALSRAIAGAACPHQIVSVYGCAQSCVCAAILRLCAVFLNRALHGFN